MVSFRLDDDCWPADFKLLVAQGEESLRIITGFQDASFRISEASWNLDLDSGTVVFASADGIKATCEVQIVGTYNTRDGTWLWGWDHPSVRPELRMHAHRAKKYGEEHGIACLITRKFECSESDAWKFTAFASHLSAGQGAYCGPADGTLIFMTFTSVVLRKDGPND